MIKEYLKTLTILELTMMQHIAQTISDNELNALVLIEFRNRVKNEN